MPRRKSDQPVSIKVGDHVIDGAGSHGRVIKVEIDSNPYLSRGLQEKIYVDWQLPDVEWK